ncbi:hypothetical protein [Streptomyces paludis]|uniref:Uncharacterized protein n=1 Tax=Streptomyces paludis TaxID=2282738 RepID=A0A345HSJ3_9ACTN|nr:hypothetical protein [Streptomyces paludis]AXG79667.1 hypothetical protein DVK44_20695 [Streptomyces paludis]
MKFIVAGHTAVTATEFVELALGTPLDLWLGPDGGESEEERAARMDAARDILADDPSLSDRVSRVAVEAIEAFAPGLFDVTPLNRPTARRRARFGKGAAA